MKNIKTVVYVIGFSVLVFVIVMAIAIQYFGWQNIQIFVWALSTAVSYALGRYHTGRDMISGAKVVLASQESDDRRERESLSAIAKLYSAIGKGQPQVAQSVPALPAGEPATDDGWEIDDADFVFVEED